MLTEGDFVSDIAIFVLKRDVKLQLTNWLKEGKGKETLICIAV